MDRARLGSPARFDAFRNQSEIKQVVIESDEPAHNC